MLKSIEISTAKNQELIDITDRIKQILKDSGIKQGICIVYVPHTTAGVLINENYDSNLCEDIIRKLNDVIPLHDNYKHDRVDSNAHSHIKASLIGPSEIIIIKNNELQLGRWQGIALAEFDGPRKRKIFVKIIKG